MHCGQTSDSSKRFLLRDEVKGEKKRNLHVFKHFISPIYFFYRKKKKTSEGITPRHWKNWRWPIVQRKRKQKIPLSSDHAYDFRVGFQFEFFLNYTFLCRVGNICVPYNGLSQICKILQAGLKWNEKKNAQRQRLNALFFPFDLWDKDSAKIHNLIDTIVRSVCCLETRLSLPGCYWKKVSARKKKKSQLFFFSFLN